MTEITELAKAMHSMENTFPVQTEDGIVTLTVKITMPADCTDKIWDAFHKKYNLLVDAARDLL